MRTTCPCKGIPTADPEIVGIQYGLRDEIKGVAYNCAVGSTHILPWSETSAEWRRRAAQVEEERLRAGCGA